VIDPQKNIPVGARLRAFRQVKGSAEEKKEAQDRPELRIGALGSGSDFTPFLQHLGIASLDIRYGGENGGGSYHSVYDSYDHYRRFGDPGFAYGIALAQTAGRVVLRLANAEVLPLEFANFAETISKYVKEVEAVFDPTQPYHLPKPASPVPFLNFAPLENALARLRESARSYHTAMNKPHSTRRLPSLETRKALDLILMKTERAMITEAGLPGRPWYKHQIYAPGFYTGYGVKTLPGVREAIEGRRWTEAGEQIEIAAQTIGRVATEIERAAKTMGASGL
jgi:N-acetylated-alpha-linked acidic dipeptidase